MIYRFDKFELDDELFELRQMDKVCKLEQRAFDLLHYLVRRAGDLVTKEELFAQLWKGRYVCGSVLPVHMLRIRKALGESASVIQTVRGVGYRMNCAVQCIGTSRSVPPPVRAVKEPRDDALDSVVRITSLLYLGLLLPEPKRP